MIIQNKVLMINSLIISLFTNGFLLIPKVNSAEKILFTNGIFNRTISIKSFEHLAKTGEARGSLKNLINLTNQSPKKLSDLLNKEFNLSLIVTSKLMHSSIGEVMITRTAKVIHPMKIKNKKISIYAIRAAITNSIVKGNGKLSILQFLKSYPNKKMEIDVPALFKVINKVDSMSELVKFFAESPLEGIKRSNTKL